ncbi:hypothetical protein HMPREF1544_00067 [Mucor circinelloides 1006PhL]|uniref:PHD-type domain-containing protein n=1 Tax=Mucor circinelloides f. circinelloides (strain 1006PhL) TaxID=1220926 RepID=S2KBX5_MUCC1|nr:hypothetical protein HMPREF1544_00067 [Mucor circinelloides 1006PhL]
MSSEEEQDACNVCEGDNSPSKNPIIFCDGKGCNMPVHKRCYGLKQVPDGDWFCQRCENKKKKKATNIICCPVQTGAIKKTKLQDKYMHIVCALWNKDIDNTVEPYPVPENQLNKQISDSEDSDEDEDDDFEGEEEDDDDDDDDEEEEEDEDEDMEPEKKKDNKGKGFLTKKENTEDSNKDNKSKVEDDSSSTSSSANSSAVSSQAHPKKVLAIGNKPSSSSSSGFGTPSTIRSPSMKKEIPMKRRLSPNSLFGHDQSSDDSDDDMGTKSRPKSTSSNASSNNNNNNHNKSLASMSSKHAERIEAKRKKSGLESISTSSTATALAKPSILEDMKKPPTSLTPPLPTGTPSKQKLPNKAHLSNSISMSTNASNSTTIINTPSSISSSGNGHRPAITPPIKKQNGPGIIKDIDEIQNDIRAGAQRWNNTSNTPLHHPQPTTPHSISTTFFENDGKSRMDNNRKSINGGEKEELMRMREENRKLLDFKRTVTEVLTNLNVPLQSGLLPSADVDNYVAQLQLLLKRVGPIRENERVQIQECVKGALQHNNSQQHPQ